VSSRTSRLTLPTLWVILSHSHSRPATTSSLVIPMPTSTPFYWPLSSTSAFLSPSITCTLFSLLTAKFLESVGLTVAFYLSYESAASISLFCDTHLCPCICTPVCFQKNKFQAFIEFSNVQSAILAKENLEGKDLFQGCNTFMVSFASQVDIQMARNNLQYVVCSRGFEGIF
jgi:hypothetical protein